MNERIKQLAARAGVTEVQGLLCAFAYQGPIKADFLEEFAQLIVQDYAKKTIQGLMSDPAFVQAMDEYYENKWSHRFD
jgi:hypothetical protein